jgi:uncharacterized protein YjcR
MGMVYRINNRRHAKVNADAVIDIRKLFADGMTQRELAQRYDVAVGTIGRIVRGESWKTLPMIRTEQEIEHDMALDDGERSEEMKRRAAEFMEGVQRRLETADDDRPPIVDYVELRKRSDEERRLKQLAELENKGDSNVSERTADIDSLSGSDDTANGVGIVDRVLVDSGSDGGLGTSTPPARPVSQGE